jgi:hypothetical protein
VTCTSLIGLNSTRLNMMTDVACDFIEPSGEDTLEYEKQHQFKLDTCGCKTIMGVMQ